MSKDIPRAHALMKQMAIIRQLMTEQRFTKKGVDKKLRFVLEDLKRQYDEALREW